MNFREYQTLASRTMKDHESPREELSDYTLGLCGEAGEVAESVKKHLYHGQNRGRTEAMVELGDVLWYLAAICETMDCSLDQVARMNIAKLSGRHPGEGFSPEYHEKVGCQSGDETCSVDR